MRIPCGRVGPAPLAGLFFGLALTVSGPVPAMPRIYDDAIRQAAHDWLPGVDWRLYKAQLVQESGLNPDAVSPVGARGLAQFMPATWADMVARFGWPQAVSPHTPGLAIAAGARYMAGLRRAAPAALSPEPDRHDYALASYNAGLGNVRRAWRLCGAPPAYAAGLACLPAITGRHAAETLAYRERIRTWFSRFLARP